MDSNLPSSPTDSGSARAAFRKPSNDVVNRKYRRRSPVDGSSSSDGSPNGARVSNHALSKEYTAKSYDRRKQDDTRNLDREYGRSKYGRTSDSHKNYDRQSSRNSDNYQRYDDYKREKCVNEDERKLSSRSNRDSRAGNQPDYTSRDGQQNRSRDDRHNSDKYTRGKTDGSGHRSRDRDGGTSPVEYNKAKDRGSSPDRVGSTRSNLSSGVKAGDVDRHRGTKHDRDDKREYQRSVGDRQSDHSPNLESRGYRHNITSRRDSSRHQVEISEGDDKELDCQKYTKEKKKYHSPEYEHKEQSTGEAAKMSESITTFTSGSLEKKPKLFSLDERRDQRKYVSSFTTAADEKEPLSSQKAEISVGKEIPDQGVLKDSDIDAAKVAAMKAAELVNKNLVGTGYMTADQKKKLLWGNKKSTMVEESPHRWDTSLFSDRERQEKFNKLMGVKGEPKVEHKPDHQEGSGIQTEKQNQLQMDLEKQYTAGLRRRDGRTVGLGL